MVAEVEISEDLSVLEAAYLAGASERSIRNWMRSGKLPYLVSEQGKRIRRQDLLDLLQERRKHLTAPDTGTPEPDTGHSPEAPGPTPVPPVAEQSPLLDLLKELHRENVELAGRLGFYQAEIEKYKERILLLEAPKTVATPVTLPREEVPTEPPVQAPVQGEVQAAPVSRPWYRRLFGME